MLESLYGYDDTRLIKKAVKVINSCKTMDQLITARRYIKLAIERAYFKRFVYDELVEAASDKFRQLRRQQ